MSLRSAYLTIYNGSLALGWAYLLWLSVSVLAAGGSLWELWKTVEVPLKIVQTAAIAEVVHASIGIVRSPPLVTALQVASRVFLVWGVVNLAPEVATGSQVAAIPIPGVGRVGLSFATLVIAWALSEIIRYGHFAAKEAGIASKLLLWLRYTGFLVLYPLGVSSELTMVYLVAPYVKKHGILSLEMPNAVNFAFSYYTALWIVSLTYIPGFPMLYGYMLKQRKKMLGGGAKAKKLA